MEAVPQALPLPWRALGEALTLRFSELHTVGLREKEAEGEARSVALPLCSALAEVLALGV